MKRIIKLKVKIKLKKRKLKISNLYQGKENNRKTNKVPHNYKNKNVKNKMNKLKKILNKKARVHLIQTLI